MKTTIAIISPSTGIGGGDRKFKIYYKYLNPRLFEKYLIYFKEGKGISKTQEGYVVGKKSIVQFLKEKKISYTYVSPQLGNAMIQEIKKVSTILWNVNFTPIHKEEDKVINLVISKTDYWKIHWLKNKQLKNTYVVYNPIDYTQWTTLAKKVKPLHKQFFKNKHIKTIIGRLGRAEPTKWNYLNIATLLQLQKKKNYKYGFIFAGIPLLYRITLKILLNKQMKQNILFLPELREFEKIAEFYQSIDVFWQTSRIGESFGNVIAEAFCFEKPVITDYKDFLGTNNQVNPKKYDAQIELVDHKINGSYCNYPKSIIHFLENHSTKQLQKMGKIGKEKVKTTYDAKFAGETISKILTKTITSTNTIPSKTEVKQYAKEYKQRIQQARNANKLASKQKRNYFINNKLWESIEFIYLIQRKALRIIGLDMEKW